MDGEGGGSYLKRFGSYDCEYPDSEHLGTFELIPGIANNAVFGCIKPNF